MASSSKIARLITVEDLLRDVALRLNERFELLDEVLCRFGIHSSCLPMACNTVDAIPVLKLIKLASTGLDRHFFLC